MNWLSGWQRLGIVLTVLWCVLVVGAVTTAYYQYAQQAAIEAADAECRENAQKGPATAEQEKACGTALTGREAGLGRTPWPPVMTLLALLLLPIAGGWSVVYVAIWATRWVRAGFSPKRRREDITAPPPEGRRARKPALRR